MNKELFLEYVESLRKALKMQRVLRDVGVDIMDGLIDQSHEFLKKSIWNKEQIENIDWWLYDCPNGIDGDNLGGEWTTITFGDGSQLKIATAEQLYDYLETIAN